MLRSIVLALSLASAAAFQPAVGRAARAVGLQGTSSNGFDLSGGVPVYDKSKMATKADLEKLAAELNPLVKFWDPLNLAEAEFWGDSNQATIGWLRQAEIKHGRVAMFAFVGYCVQANGYHCPWPMTLSGDSFPAMSSPPEQWDAIPEAAKWQIMLTVAFLEGWDESQRAVHYMRGGQPGAFPPLTGPNSAMPHSVPFDLFDPFGLSKNRSAEAKARGLKAELNNGRLAQIGIFGFLAEAKVEGSVPALSGLGIQHYSGDFMAPFAADFHTMLAPALSALSTQ